MQMMNKGKEGAAPGIKNMPANTANGGEATRKNLNIMKPPGGGAGSNVVMSRHSAGTEIQFRGTRGSYGKGFNKRS